MKKLITSYNGGYPIFDPDYFNHVQTGFIEVVNELVLTYLSNSTAPTAIRGCVVTSPGSAASCTSGSIYFNNELFLVNAQTIGGSGTLYWQVVESYATIDPVLFADGTTHSVFANRNLILTYTNPGSNGFANSSLVYYGGVAALIAVETAARVAADNTLQGNITSEATTRLAIDTAIQASVTNEANTRFAVDNALSSSIAAEASARASAISNLMTIFSLSTITTDLTGGLSYGIYGAKQDFFLLGYHVSNIMGQFTFGYNLTNTAHDLIKLINAQNPAKALTFPATFTCAGQGQSIGQVYINNDGTIGVWPSTSFTWDGTNAISVYFNMSFRP